MSVTYEEALEALTSRLSPESLAHSVRASQTAGALAVVYGADEATARLAGLLHDWDRDSDHGVLLDSARTSGIEVSATDGAHPYLLHARTGAQGLSRAMPGLSADVLDAVARHTIGGAQMSDIDKIVYLADMLEPERDFEGVDDLREVVGTVSLDELFAQGYQHSMMHLVRERKQIHPESLAVWNAHVAGGSR